MATIKEQIELIRAEIDKTQKNKATNAHIGKLKAKIAALKANVHPIRIVRHKKSIEQYGKNYFGNVLQGKSIESPFRMDDLKIFYSKSVGIYGESIYPIIWDGP